MEVLGVTGGLDFNYSKQKALEEGAHLMPFEVFQRYAGMKPFIAQGSG